MRRYRAFLWAGAALLAVIVGAVTMVRSEDAAAAKPPPVDQGTAHVDVGAERIRTGDVLTFTVRNPTTTPFEYGLAMTVQRWDGKAWQPAYQAAASMGGQGSGKEGALAAPGEPLMVAAIALNAPAGGAGPQQQLRLSDVPAGWYRLVVDRVGGATQATGVVEVVR